MIKLKPHDIIATLALSVAVGFLLAHVWQSVRPVNTKILDILSPVEVHQSVYKYGETVKGEFQGERYVATPTLYTRMIQCDNFRAALKPFKLDAPFVGEIFGLIGIIALNDNIFLNPDIKLPNSASNCRLIFGVEHDLYSLPLGGYRTIKGNSFETTTFDIRGE